MDAEIRPSIRNKAGYSYLEIFGGEDADADVHVRVLLGIPASRCRTRCVYLIDIPSIYTTFRLSIQQYLYLRIGGRRNQASYSHLELLGGEDADANVHVRVLLERIHRLSFHIVHPPGKCGIH